MIIEEMVSILSDSEKLTEAGFRKRLNELMKGKKLHEEIEALKKYRSDTKGKIAKDHGIKLQQYMMYFIFTDEVAEMIGEAWRQSENKDETQYRINASTKLYSKTRQIMLDMLSLFENGGLLSCLVLWRSIYENYVFAKYLLGSPDEESNRFNDYSMIQISALSKQYESDHKREIAQLKEKYGDGFREPFGWITQAKTKSISGVIKHTKERQFEGYYQLTSMQLHASPFSVNRSILHQDGHGNTESLGAFSEGLSLPFNLVISIMSEFSEMLIDFFPLEDWKEVVALTNKALATSAFIPESVGPNV